MKCNLKTHINFTDIFIQIKIEQTNEYAKIYKLNFGNSKKIRRFQLSRLSLLLYFRKEYLRIWIKKLCIFYVTGILVALTPLYIHQYFEVWPINACDLWLSHAAPSFLWSYLCLLGGHHGIKPTQLHCMFA